ncbi:MAG: AMP-binding protein [Pseudomonadota bacterium]
MPHSLEEARTAARSHPDKFWGDAAASLHWERQWSSVSPEQAVGPWFSGGVINTCFNALDRHVLSGFGKRNALIAISAMTDERVEYSYAELLLEVQRVAGAMQRSGISYGDRVVIYMPMVAQAVIAMLACARIGAVHSVVFGGFAARELAKRIDDAKPALILTASCGFEPGKTIEYLPLIREATHGRNVPVVVLQRKSAPRELDPKWQDWDDWMVEAPQVDCVSVEADAPLYILYTSGTTGKPKGIVRANAGHAVALLWSMRHVFGVEAGDVFWAASDIGWVVGHSYIVYGPLLAGCTTVLFEGKPVGTPDCETLWRIVEDAQVNVLFTAPTAVRAIRREDADGKRLAMHPMSSLRALFLAGERTDPETLHWIETKLKRPIIDNWWQTELGWPALGRCLGLESEHQAPGSAGWPVPGFEAQVVDNLGQECPPNTLGELVVRVPLPPGACHELWNGGDRYSAHYLERYPGFFASGDMAYLDARGCVFVMGRSDDLINVAGHRLSTGAMEAAVAETPGIVECAVVARRDGLKGQVPVAFAVKADDSATGVQQLENDVVQNVRQTIGAVAALKEVHIVSRLPKTRSGKILRKTLAEILDTGRYETPATIDDPEILQSISRDLAAGGRY